MGGRELTLCSARTDQEPNGRTIRASSAVSLLLAPPQTRVHVTPVSRRFRRVGSCSSLMPSISRTPRRRGPPTASAACTLKLRKRKNKGTKDLQLSFADRIVEKAEKQNSKKRNNLTRRSDLVAPVV